MTTPTSMEPRPAMRNSRSGICSSRVKARFTPWGLRNGAMASNTRNRPSAASRSLKFSATGAPGSAPRRRRRLGRILQVPEEHSVGRHHQQITVLAEGAVVGLETAVESVELGILRVSACVSLGGSRIALAADAPCVALGAGDDHRALALGRGADAGAGALPFRTQPARGLGAALLHAFVHPRRHLVRQIDALHTHVHQVDTETCGI